jgi:hypothetical protein
MSDLDHTLQTTHVRHVGVEPSRASVLESSGAVANPEDQQLVDTAHA